ncbi:hypothetical protein [Neobacillus sp. 19]|uniref:hypothetical protein n=1 Tax=Neobacillus sp. 19 TaxID=3394458 RepID=UPI003BF6685C
MRINLSEVQMLEIKRIVEKEILIKAIVPTDDYLFIKCFAKRQKEIVYYHLFAENDTLIIRCYARVFDSLGLSIMIKSTAKKLFDYLINQTGLKYTKYIENGVVWTF